MKEFKLDEDNRIPAGFNPPDSYFDTLQESVFARIEEQQKVITPFQRRSFYFAAAAVIILALGLIFTFNLGKTENLPAENLVGNYLDVHNTLPDEEIALLLDDSDIAQIKSEVSPDIEYIQLSLESNPELEYYILN